ncbi:hypothetical protein GW17_00061718 [Ensete ventricosum]|nr:hypothetical protein GW17_00061718 [Ensete ventricosum]
MCCATTESCAKLTEVRGIANSKNSVLMQGLVCGRWSVRGHPKAIGTQHHRALKLPLRHGKDTSQAHLRGTKQCTDCSVRRSSPRGWWSSKLPEGRMQRGKLLKQDRYPRGIGPGSP